MEHQGSQRRAASDGENDRHPARAHEAAAGVAQSRRRFIRRLISHQEAERADVGRALEEPQEQRPFERNGRRAGDEQEAVGEREQRRQLAMAAGAVGEQAEQRRSDARAQHVDAEERVHRRVIARMQRREERAHRRDQQSA